MAAISVALVGFFLIAYFIPFIYTGNYVAGTPRTPAPGSEIYGSLTCILSLHLAGYYNTGPEFVLFIAPGTPPAPHWNWLGTTYQGGHYYFFCNPQYVTVPPK